MKILKLSLLSLILLPFAAAAEDAAKAKIVTGTELAAQCISSVHVNNIDGREVKVQSLGFDIDPGTHTMTGRALINTSFCKAVGPGNQRYSVEPLEADFEAGKTYYVGYDHSSSNRKDWKLTIWKVEG
jgi:hypothetical protein